MPNYLTHYRRTRTPGFIPGITPVPPVILPDQSNLVVWLKDSGLVGLADNDPISTWVDESGNGHDATQGTADYKPLCKTNILNGYEVARFDGSNDQLFLGNISGSFSTAASLFVVCYLNSAPGYNVYTSQSGTDQWWKWQDSENGYLGTFRTARLENYPAAMPTTGWHIFTLISGANYTFYLDTVSKGTQAASFQAGNDHRIGWNEGNYFRWLKGDIAELIVYSTDKSSTRVDIETYLKNKYAI